MLFIVISKIQSLCNLKITHKTNKGIVVSMINTNIIMTGYDPCLLNENQSTQTTTIFAWIASLCAYIMIWKIDFSINIIKLSVCKKFLWFITARLITLIIGGSFVRVIYLSETNDDKQFCYCNNDDLLLANSFTIIYIGIWPIAWILHKLRILKLIMIIGGYIFTKYIKCESINCCCKIRIKVETPTAPVGKMCSTCFKPCCLCCTKLCTLCTSQFTVIITFIAFIITPLICIGIRLRVIGDKWENHLIKINNKSQLDITDIVFIWILSVMMTFFMITGVLKLKRKYFPPKQIATNDTEKTNDTETTNDTEEIVEIQRLRTMSKTTKDNEQVIDLKVAENEVHEIKKQLEIVTNEKEDIESKYRKLSEQTEQFQSLKEENETLRKRLSSINANQKEET